MALLFHVAIINDYGLTWDFHFHFFGGGHLLGYTWQQLEPRIFPYVEPDPRNAWNLPYGPIMSMPPVASFMLLYRLWHLLPADNAYNLPIILWGVAGIAIVYIFVKQAFSSRIAILAGIFIALTPRFFADMHNNMKDVPSAVAFALNMWLLWRLVRFRRPIDLLWAAFAFAIAFNVKINSIYIPAVYAVWILLTHLSIFKMQSLFRHEKILLWYVFLAPLTALGLWSLFWPHPIAQLIQAYSTFGIGTNNIEVLLNGSWYCSGSTVPWYYPYWYLAITTPVLVLALFFIGLIRLIRRIKPIGVLLLLWLFLPLSRYFIPTIGVIDGIRHFEEVVFPIAVIAALGFDAVLTFIHRIKGVRIFAPILMIGTVLYLLFTVAWYHPYQITYFNELVGGAAGAFGKYDLDYWGTSQKAAIVWINTHAPKNANVYIAMAPDIAGTYLRPDLLTNLNKVTLDKSDFVVILNRQSFYYRFYYIFEYILRHAPVYTVRLHDTPLTWIYDNKAEHDTPRQTPWWSGEDPCILQYWKGK
jgi:hypothetical protein